jgi:UPF0176 protein
MTHVSEIVHDAFYRFVAIDAPERLQQRLKTLCEHQGLLGTILLAHEGINGMLAGPLAALDAFRKALEADARFSGIHYKRTRCQKPPFKRLKVLVKPEIVPLGVAGVDAARYRGIDLSPAEWRALIRQEDVVLIDNRNAFEYEMGHFVGALNPGVKNFREFAGYLKAQLDAWQGKRIAMYCTGGIRCEKTSAWLAARGLEVYQLQGGILNFFAQIPDAEQDYQGVCFVFDDRVALDPQLNEIEL